MEKAPQREASRKRPPEKGCVPFKKRFKQQHDEEQNEEPEGRGQAENNSIGPNSNGLDSNEPNFAQSSKEPNFLLTSNDSNEANPQMVDTNGSRPTIAVPGILRPRSFDGQEALPVGPHFNPEFARALKKICDTLKMSGAPDYADADLVARAIYTGNMDALKNVLGLVPTLHRPQSPPGTPKLMSEREGAGREVERTESEQGERAEHRAEFYELIRRGNNSNGVRAGSYVPNERNGDTVVNGRQESPTSHGYSQLENGRLDKVLTSGRHTGPYDNHMDMYYDGIKSYTSSHHHDPDRQKSPSHHQSPISHHHSPYNGGRQKSPNGHHQNDRKSFEHDMYHNETTTSPMRTSRASSASRSSQSTPEGYTSRRSETVTSATMNYTQSATVASYANHPHPHPPSPDHINGTIFSNLNQRPSGVRNFLFSSPSTPEKMQAYDSRVYQPRSAVSLDKPSAETSRPDHTDSLNVLANAAAVVSDASRSKLPSSSSTARVYDLPCDLSIKASRSIPNGFSPPNGTGFFFPLTPGDGLQSPRNLYRSSLDMAADNSKQDAHRQLGFGSESAAHSLMVARSRAYDSRANGYDPKTNGYDPKTNGFDPRENGHDPRTIPTHSVQVARSREYDSRTNGYDPKTNGYDQRSNGYDARENDDTRASSIHNGPMERSLEYDSRSNGYDVSENRYDPRENGHDGRAIGTHNKNIPVARPLEDDTNSSGRHPRESPSQYGYEDSRENGFDPRKSGFDPRENGFDPATRLGDYFARGNYDQRANGSSISISPDSNDTVGSSSTASAFQQGDGSPSSPGSTRDSDSPHSEAGRGRGSRGNAARKTKVLKHVEDTLRETGEYPLCVVCGDVSSGFHYNKQTCEGCKGFFRRSLQVNKKTGESKKYEPCKKNGQCEVNKYTREKCKICRLKKCIRMGMDTERVLNPEQLEVLNYKKAVSKDVRARQEKEKEEVERAKNVSQGDSYVIQLARLALDKVLLAEQLHTPNNRHRTIPRIIPRINENTDLARPHDEESQQEPEPKPQQQQPASRGKGRKGKGKEKNSVTVTTCVPSQQETSPVPTSPHDHPSNTGGVPVQTVDELMSYLSGVGIMDLFEKELYLMFEFIRVFHCSLFGALSSENHQVFRELLHGKLLKLLVLFLSWSHNNSDNSLCINGLRIRRQLVDELPNDGRYGEIKRFLSQLYCWCNNKHLSSATFEQMALVLALCYTTDADCALSEEDCHPPGGYNPLDPPPQTALVETLLNLEHQLTVLIGYVNVLKKAAASGALWTTLPVNFSICTSFKNQWTQLPCNASRQLAERLLKEMTEARVGAPPYQPPSRHAAAVPAIPRVIFSSEVPQRRASFSHATQQQYSPRTSIAKEVSPRRSSISYATKQQYSSRNNIAKDVSPITATNSNAHSIQQQQPPRISIAKEVLPVSATSSSNHATEQQQPPRISVARDVLPCSVTTISNPATQQQSPLPPSPLHSPNVVLEAGLPCRRPRQSRRGREN